jgi:hypothetical protein
LALEPLKRMTPSAETLVTNAGLVRQDCFATKAIVRLAADITITLATHHALVAASLAR